MKFGDFLIQNEFVGQNAVNEALMVQMRLKRQKLGRLLVELGHLDKPSLNLALTRYFNPSLNESALELRAIMAKAKPTPEILKLAKRYKALATKEDQYSIEFIRVDLIDDDLLAQAEEATGKNASCFIVSKDTFEYLSSSAKGQEANTSKIVVTKALSDDDKLCTNSPYTKLFKEALGEAKKRSVSDIHIEPTSNGVTIRFRLFGALSAFKTLGPDHREGFITTVKSIVNMDLAIIGRPQDSRASFKEFKVDIRANSLPELYGEKLVLRLLDQERDFKLESSGLDNKSLHALRSSARRKDGLVLISGPTGSGKTTTLYSLLSELPRDRLNISTLENPVEYELSGINQVNINENGILTFESSLRALMRQDPDVILVGEIRDHETASLAFKAASTGHLVLSTVHANGAKEVVERLLNLGIDAFTIKSNLRLSSAQRLIPTLCKNCSLPLGNADVKELEGYFNKGILSNLRKANAKGCSSCQAGINGRIAILEYMDKEEITFFFNDTKAIETLPKHSLKDAALKLASSGTIDALEVLSFI
ncbi:GspE/PulE family protein [Halobacteriovorax sp. DA5]|uniref:GspE/PulE family protein n=1 Tax=Halobacteriovorax sp. DA5 TaxID=2067553 RepID=UPI001304C30F|nr:ATPase, T2SS/T4P/T4SS family [Halobacteriovorax sp. DA5]